MLWLDFGEAGALDALVNFGGGSAAAPDDQDGWAAGWLSSLDVTLDGTLWGRFTNGMSAEIARIDVQVPEPATVVLIGDRGAGLAATVRRPASSALSHFDHAGRALTCLRIACLQNAVL